MQWVAEQGKKESSKQAVDHLIALRQLLSVYSIKNVIKYNITRSEFMKTRKKIALAKDPKKECLFKELSGVFKEAGVLVRREKLKTGPGWKVISGACRVENQSMVFVDPRLPQDDQILFLRARAQELGVKLAIVEKEAEPEIQQVA